jgi:hypothetical protein
VDIPASTATAGAAARFLLRENTEVPQGRDLSDRSVSESVRAIVAEVAGISPNKVHEHTTWRELGF